MKPIKASSGTRIRIGQAQEKNARDIVFDVREWMERIPYGVPVLYVTTSEGETILASSVTQDREAGTVTWTPTSAETKEGEGHIQLCWMDETHDARTPVMETECDWSIDGDDAQEAEAGEPSFVQAAAASASAAMQSAQDAQEARNAAESARANAAASASAAAQHASAVMGQISAATNAATAAAEAMNRAKTEKAGAAASAEAAAASAEAAAESAAQAARAKYEIGEMGGTGGSCGGAIPKITVTYTQEIEIAPNTMTEIEELTGAITITLSEDGFDNEWDFVIQQGATAQMVSLPEIVWGMGIAPTFAANTLTVVRLYSIGGTMRGEWCV